MPATDRASTTRDHVDRFGDAERHRITRDAPGRVSLEVHRRFLAEHVRPTAHDVAVGGAVEARGRRLPAVRPLRTRGRAGCR